MGTRTHVHDGGPLAGLSRHLDLATGAHGDGGSHGRLLRLALLLLGRPPLRPLRVVPSPLPLAQEGPQGLCGDTAGTPGWHHGSAGSSSREPRQRLQAQRGQGG